MMTTDDLLQPRAVKQATNLVRDARLAIMVGLIPILGLIFILRLVQWYLLRNRYPLLASGGDELSRDFRSALHRLWFAVLLWPATLGIIFVYIALT